jgi:hypothetical protein
MKDFNDGFCGEWRGGATPEVCALICVVSISDQHFAYSMLSDEVEDFKEWIARGNWYGDDIPDFDETFEGNIDDWLKGAGIDVRELPVNLKETWRKITDRTSSHD